MVQPKTIGKEITVPPLSAEERRFDIQVMVPRSNKIRKVEAFNAAPSEGVSEIITEKNSSFEFLRLARIKLSAGHQASRSLLMEEAIYYVNRGTAKVTSDQTAATLGKGDLIYVGIDAEVEITTDTGCDISEFKAVKCHTKHPTKVVRHTDIEGTPLAADLGTKRPMSTRTVFKLVDQNIQTCRLLFGDTYMANKGGVGSYPPHFHGPDGPLGLGANAKEEIYHFRCESDIEGDIPYVLQNCALPEEKINVYAHVFDEVAINVTPTYHDTLAPPSVDFMFTWCLASFTEGHRDWSEIYNKPGFENEW